MTPFETLTGSRRVPYCGYINALCQTLTAHCRLQLNASGICSTSVRDSERIAVG